jgi:hypothetical protein
LLCYQRITLAARQSEQNFFPMKTSSLRSIAIQIRKFIKLNNIPHAMVNVKGNLLIIDNLGYDTAQNIAQIVTGLDFVYLTPSMTKLK